MDTSKMSKSAKSRYYRYIRRYKSIASKADLEEAAVAVDEQTQKRIKVEKPDNSYDEDRRIAKALDENDDKENLGIEKKIGKNADDKKGREIAKKIGKKADDEMDREISMKIGKEVDDKDREIAKKIVRETDEEDRKIAKKTDEDDGKIAKKTDEEDRKIAKKTEDSDFVLKHSKSVEERRDFEKTIKTVANLSVTEEQVKESKIQKATDSDEDIDVINRSCKRRRVLSDSSDTESEDKEDKIPPGESSSEYDSADESTRTLYRRLKRKRRVAYPSDTESDDDFACKRIKSEPLERSSSPGIAVPGRAASPEYDLPAQSKKTETPMQREKPEKPIKQEKPEKPIKPEKPDRPIKQEKLDESSGMSSSRVELAPRVAVPGGPKIEDSSDTEDDDVESVDSFEYPKWKNYSPPRTPSDEDDENDEDYTPDEYEEFGYWGCRGPPIKKDRSLFKDNSFEIDPAFLMPKLDDIRDLGKKAQATLHREQSLTVERLKDLHGSLVARPVENERAKDPPGLKVALMPHQQHALAWLQWREKEKPRGGVLADEMGLGKTLTMIALVMASIARIKDGEDSENEDEWKNCARGQRHLGGTLVVVPASLLAQWAGEVKNRCKRDTITVEVYHGAKRETQPKRLAKNDIVITTYNIVCREYKMQATLFKIRWRRVILDEAHVIRNHKKKPCQSVCGLYTSKRWAVTGTPLHNKESDLYSLLKFLQCSPFDDYGMWRKWVDNRNDAGHQRLATVMKTLMLRRTKSELHAKGELPPLPDKTVSVIEVALDDDERLIYDKVMLFSRTLFAQFLDQRAAKARNFEFGGRSYENLAWNYRGTTFTKAQKRLLSQHADVQAHEILVLLIRLRQICCHPSLIKAMLDRDDIELQTTGVEIFAKSIKLDADSDDEDIIDDFEVDERVTEHLLTSGNPVFDPKRQSSKMRAVISKIEEILDQGDKLIVVSQWVSVLNILAKELDLIDGAAYRMFTGQVAVKDRQDVLDEFNSENDEPNILLLSLTAGGVGLNVVGANHMLLVDIHWNPQLESQAQDRIHRFGQTKDVSIYKYICTDTIEERIQALQNKKLELARQVLSGTGQIIGSKLTLDDIKTLFGV